MARTKKQLHPPKNVDATPDGPEDSDNDERGRTVLTIVGKAVQAGTKIPLEWHPRKKIPIGSHRSQFSTYIGVVARERVNITHKEWNDLGDAVLEEVYEIIARGFYVPEGRKGWVLTRASLRWRAFKTRLRKKYMYLKNGMLSDKPPPKYPFIRQNDWTKFVEYCTSDTFKEKELEKQGIHVSNVPRHLTWIKAHFHEKDGVITFENPIDKEIHDAIKILEAQVQRGEIVANVRNDILARALNKPEHGGSVRAVGSGISNKEYFGFNKPTPPNHLHAELNMMKSEMGVMKNFQNFIMTCLSPQQLTQFIASSTQFSGLLGTHVNGFGGIGGQISGFGGIGGGNNGFSSSHDSDNQGFMELLTRGMERQESRNDHFTNGCSKERSHEDAYIVYGSQTRHTTDPHIHQLNHQQQHDPYHVPSPQPPPYVPDQIASNLNLAHKPHHMDNIHNLTFPEGWNDCCLTIEGDDKDLQIVANGQVFIPSTTEILSAHGPPMPPSHCRVTIVEDIVPNALVPCPNDEIRYVCQARKSFTPWPTYLILPKKANMQSEKEMTTPSTLSPSSQGSSSRKYVISDEDNKKVTSNLLHDLKNRAISMEKRRETISLSMPEMLFLNKHAVDAILDYEDMFQWCFQKEVGEVHMNIFMKYLKERCQDEGVSGMFGFCDANVLSLWTPAMDEKDRSDYLSHVFGWNNGKNKNQLFFAPYNEGRHWMLAAISPWNGVVYWLDPAGVENEIRDVAKRIINEGILIFNKVHRKDLLKITKNSRIVWKKHEGPRQPFNTKDCGYYVCRFMLEIVQNRAFWVSNQVFSVGSACSYSSSDIDEIRNLWIEYVFEHHQQ
ncbi:hypothetical protein OROMI_018869 [Orobanche minor]